MRPVFPVAGCFEWADIAPGVARNRVQICMMSHNKRKNLQVLLGHMQSNLKLLH